MDTSAFTTTSLADIATSTIDRLVKLRPFIDQTCFEFTIVSYFVVHYFRRGIFTTKKLLNHVELIMQM